MSGKAAPKKKQQHGAKPRGTRKELSCSTWYSLCSQYHSKKSTFKSAAAFLRSFDSGDDISGTLSEQNTFSCMMKLFNSDLLQPEDKKQIHAHEFQDIEDKLIEYIELRERLFQKDKCGVNWGTLQEKCLAWAEAAGHTSFKASPGWIDRVFSTTYSMVLCKSCAKHCIVV
jgi:hypothetical protein